jgi:NAD(P)-dependent dehydrogenase (short-subunit alcohol dehydrogenase family)
MAGRRVLVVGASSGIGRGMGLVASRQGAEVVFAARRRERLEDAVAEAGRGWAVTGDLAVPGEGGRIVAEAVGHLGGLDLVVFAAGWAPLARLDQIEDEDWKQAFAVNVLGGHQVIKAAVPHVAGRGIIAVVSSHSTMAPYTGLAGYGATKTALEHVVRVWRMEHPGLRITCINMGSAMPTEFGADFSPELAMELFPEWAAFGLAQQEFMSVSDVCQALVDVFAAVLPFPGVGLTDIVLRSPSAQIAGVDVMAETFESTFVEDVPTT